MKRFFLLLSLLLVSPVLAEGTVTPNVAVLPIVGDRNILPEQLTFLTGKFAGELLATKSFSVLDRSKMEYILSEQGFQQSGACNSSECQVQMGQLLGVSFIIGGNLVRFGSKFAFRVDYIDVSTGQVLLTVEHTESGELEDVYEGLCKGTAVKLAKAISPSSANGSAEVHNTVPKDAIPTQSAKPLSFKRKMALALWGTSLISLGGAAYFDTKVAAGNDAYDKAYEAHIYADTKDAWNDIQSAELRRNIGGGISIGTFVVGAVLWFLPEGK